MALHSFSTMISLYAKSSKSEIDSVIKGLKDAGNEITSIQQKINKAGKTNYILQYNNGLKKVTETFTEMGEPIKSTTTLMKQGFDTGKLIFYGNMLRGLANKFKNIANEAINFNETTEKFNVSMGESVLSATKFQNRISEQFGTSRAEMMNYQSNFKNIMAGLGDMSSQQAEKVSESLTQMSLDYSSLFNVSQSTAANKIQAALTGQIMPIRRESGYDVSKNAVMQKAKDLGLEKTYSELTETEKRLMRIMLLMEQMKRTGAFEDLSRTIESPSNQLKVLQNQLQELKIWLGNVFIGTIGTILPYINAFVMALKELIKMLATLVGFEPIATGTDDILQEATDATADIGANIGGATKQAKEFRRQLQGFDVLNVLKTPSESGGGGGGGVGGIDPKILDAFGQYTDYLTNAHMKATDIRDAIMDWLGFTKQIDDATGEVTWKLKEGYTRIEKIKDILGTIGGVLLGFKIGKDVLNFANMFLGDKALSAGDIWLKAAGVGLVVGGVYLLYQGIKTYFEDGKMTAQSFLEILGGGALLSSGAALMFKKPAILKIGILATLVITLATSIVSWWNEYFDEQKEQLYGEDKDLNLGEFLHVSFSAVGEGFANAIQEMLDTDIIDSIINWFSEHDIARLILGTILDVLTFGLMHDQIGEELKKTGKKIIEKIATGIGIAKDEGLLSEKTTKTLDDVTETCTKWKDRFDTFNKWYDEKVAPVFDEENWETLAQLAMNAVYNKLSEFNDKINSVKEWFNENVAPWFTWEKWSELATKAKDALTTKIDEIKNKHPIQDWWNENVAPWFTWEKWYSLAQDALDALRIAFENFNFSDLFKTPRVVVDAGQAPYGIGGQGRAPKMDIKWYAGGGFPKVGEIFGMSEAGPELMGTIGNRTAIMNNDQIVESVSQGVANAVSRVMGSQGGSYKLYIDGDELRNVMQQRINRSYNINGE